MKEWEISWRRELERRAVAVKSKLETRREREENKEWPVEAGEWSLGLFLLVRGNSPRQGEWFLR
jgi:hypothetical protein